MAQVVSNCFNTLEFLSKTKQITTRLVMDSATAFYFEHIYSDEQRVEQILINFLSNGMKFTPEGGSVLIELSINDIIPVS
jgi:signal transduction histidine kinase